MLSNGRGAHFMSNRIRLAYMVATPDIISRDAIGYHASIRDAAQLLRDLGYDGIELTTANPALLDWAEIHTAIETAELEVPQVCTGEVFGQDKLGLADARQEIREEALKRLKLIVDFAGEFGALVNIGRARGHYYPDVPRDQTERWALDGFRRLSHYAADRNVVIALEPIAAHVCNFINSTQDGIDWATKVDHPNFRLMLDVSHMCLEDPQPFTESFVKASGLTMHVHLTEKDRKAPGWGDMDFEAIMSTLRAIGYDRYVSVEVFNIPTQDEAIRQSARFLGPLVHPRERRGAEGAFLMTIMLQ